VALLLSSDGHPLELVLETDSRGEALFTMQVWKLVDVGLDREPRPVPDQADAPDVIRAGPEGKIAYRIPAIDLAKFGRLAVIVTRVDAEPGAERYGEYTIRLQPG
jgi:hypothetical protein